jgi:hypothetical protein
MRQLNVLALKARENQIVSFENSAISDRFKGKKEFASKTHSRCSKILFRLLLILALSRLTPHDQQCFDFFCRFVFAESFSLLKQFDRKNRFIVSL